MAKKSKNKQPPDTGGVVLALTVGAAVMVGVMALPFLLTKER